MAAVPLLEETSGGPSGAMIAELAGLAKEIGDPAHLEVLESRRPARRLAIYPASAGFDLVDELDYLSARTVELHRANMMKKLGVRSLTQALLIARDGGYV